MACHLGLGVPQASREPTESQSGKSSRNTRHLRSVTASPTADGRCEISPTAPPGRRVPRPIRTFRAGNSGCVKHAIGAFGSLGTRCKRLDDGISRINVYENAAASDKPAEGKADKSLAGSQCPWGKESKWLSVSFHGASPEAAVRHCQYCSRICNYRRERVSV